DDGVYRIALAALRGVAKNRGVVNKSSADTNRDDALPSRVFTTRDGLRSVETSWRSSGQAVSSDGQLYYATARGLAKIDTSTFRENREVPRVSLDSLTVGGKQYLVFDKEVQVENRRSAIVA